MIKMVRIYLVKSLYQSKAFQPFPVHGDLNLAGVILNRTFRPPGILEMELQSGGKYIET